MPPCPDFLFRAFPVCRSFPFFTEQSFRDAFFYFPVPLTRYCLDLCWFCFFNLFSLRGYVALTGFSLSTMKIQGLPAVFFVFFFAPAFF